MIHTRTTKLKIPYLSLRNFTSPVEKILERYTLKSGFEIHCQMLSATKLFSCAPTLRVTDASNTCANYVDLALPGMLPVLNIEVLKLALKASLALNGKIDKINGYHIRFDRKHYFYSDLPQGYQITQKEFPIMQNGFLRYYNRFNQEQKIGIERIQIEQDSARSFHDFKEYSGIDYNRAGAALLEIVTLPQVTHPTDGKIVVRELQETLKYLGISHANMEEGQMRCDLNISLSHKTDPEKRGNRVELKNVQGVKFVEKAIEAEIIRQAELLDRNEYFPIQTRRYDVRTDTTVLLREKEEDLDYRFMYDPDLPSYFISPSLISSVENDLDLVPFDFKKQLVAKYDLSVEQVQFMYSLPELVSYYESVVQKLSEVATPQLIYNWIFSVFIGNLQKKEIEDFKGVIDNVIVYKGNDRLIEVIRLQSENKISFSHAKLVLFEIIDGDNRSAFEIATSQGWISEVKTDQKSIDQIIDNILTQKSDIVEKIQKQSKSGKKIKGGPIMFLVGEAMKELKAQGDPEYVQEYIRKKILNE